VFVQVLMEASHWMKIKADRIENLMILFTMWGKITNSMKLNPSSASCAATQEFPNICGNRNFIAVFTRSLQNNPVHTTPFYLISILILCTQLLLGLPSGLLPSNFPTNLRHHSCYMSCPSYPP
jgi:hypothetical protein